MKKMVGKLLVGAGLGSVCAFASLIGVGGEARAQSVNDDSIISTPTLSTSPGDSSSSLDHVRKPTEPPAFDPTTPPAVDPSQIRVSDVVVAPPAPRSDEQSDVGGVATPVPPVGTVSSAPDSKAPIIDDDDALLAPDGSSLAQMVPGSAPIGGSNPSTTGSTIGGGLSTSPAIPPPPVVTPSPTAASPVTNPVTTPGAGTTAGVPSTATPGSTVGIDSLGQRSTVTVPGTGGTSGSYGGVPGTSTSAPPPSGSVLPAPVSNPVMPSPASPTTGVPDPSPRQPGTVDPTLPLASPDQTR